MDMEVPHVKGVNIVWTCVDDSIIEYKEESKEIVLHRSDNALLEEKEDGIVRGNEWVYIFKASN